MISERLKRVILKELELEDWDITGETIASSVPGWDSLNHVRVIDAIEAEYNLRFRSLEILKFRSVGDLQALIDSKSGAKSAA